MSEDSEATHHFDSSKVDRRSILKLVVGMTAGIATVAIQPIAKAADVLPEQGEDSLHHRLLLQSEDDEDEDKSDPLTSNVKDGIALCMSGGGYRAMLFHVGVLWRLNEFGLLPKLAMISSVSGGSITAGLLGLRWKSLAFDPHNTCQNFGEQIVSPIRGIANSTIDVKAVLSGILLPGTIGDRVRSAYAESLYGSATLQDLPDMPRFIINATNLQSGAVWRFSKPYMADYRVGRIDNPDTPLAAAVAASSAFPPILSPIELDLESAQWKKLEKQDLHRKPYTTDVVLADGGVYDNMGTETAIKRYRTILVSDAGQKTQAEEDPDSNWIGQSFRVLDLIDNQVRSLRKRVIMWLLKHEIRQGAYWGIGTDIASFKLCDVLPCPHNRTKELANLPTRLKALEPEMQERLINWGYAVCDGSMRAHAESILKAAETGAPYPVAKFPYPAAGV